LNSIDDVLKLEERTVLGKGLNSLRAEGNIPAVIHNHGQDSIHVLGSEKELLKVYHTAGKHHPLNLQVGNQKFLALIKDAHFNPVKHRLQHLVFQAIRQNETVEAEVPIKFEGEVPAEKIGLMVLYQLDAVEIEALPRDLVDELVVDATKLAELGDKLTVADIVVPSGLTILTEPEHTIATVVETKAQMSEEAEEGVGGEETAEGEAGENAEAEAAGQESEKN
jgi:large subunit ribosomal protein L25